MRQSEDARGGNMGMVLATELLGWLLLGAPFMLGVFLRVQVLRDRHQRRGKLRRAHLLEDLPRLGPERNFHPRRHLRHFQGQVIHRELLVDVLRAVRRPQRALHHRHHVVRHQGHTKPKQRGLGIAQRVHLTGQIDRQMLKGGFDRPAVGVQGGDLRGGGVRCGQVGEDMQFGLALAGGRVQLDRDPADH